MNFLRAVFRRKSNPAERLDVPEQQSDHQVTPSSASVGWCSARSTRAESSPYPVSTKLGTEASEHIVDTATQDTSAILSTSDSNNPEKKLASGAKNPVDIRCRMCDRVRFGCFGCCWVRRLCPPMIRMVCHIYC